MQKLPLFNQDGPVKANNKKVIGLDTLRVFALLLVTLQHAASVHDAHSTIVWQGISLGQTGVGVFCAISGYLAFYGSSSNANNWLIRRLLVIFPSYWVITIIAFGLSLIFGTNKPITLGLFISQMFGLGYFTHGWHLINVVSWFVSLILLCYMISYIAKKSKYKNIILMTIASFTLVAVVTRTEVDLSRHVLTFVAAALYGIHRNSALELTLPIVSVLFIAIGVYLDPQIFYSGFSLLLLTLSTKGWVFESFYIRIIAKYSYEYFLVHGICLVAAARFIPDIFISTTAAIIAASALAIILNTIDQRVQLILQRRT
jgi:peptidoglycan/LPS O-acetylase OafA/YrhL